VIGRGLKPSSPPCGLRPLRVALRARATIETAFLDLGAKMALKMEVWYWASRRDRRSGRIFSRVYGEVYVLFYGELEQPPPGYVNMCASTPMTYHVLGYNRHPRDRYRKTAARQGSLSMGYCTL